MKNKRFSETQIVSIRRMQESGKPVEGLCREHGISDVNFFNWKAQYGSMEVCDVKCMKDLKDENSLLSPWSVSSPTNTMFF
jgi:putative transposase